MTLSEEERERLGGPDGPWINDDWDGLLAFIDEAVASRERAAAEKAWEEGRLYGIAEEAQMTVPRLGNPYRAEEIRNGN